MPVARAETPAPRAGARAPALLARREESTSLFSLEGFRHEGRRHPHTPSVRRAMIDHGTAYRATIGFQNSASIVVVLRFLRTMRRNGQAFNVYHARVVYGGDALLTAVVEYPIIADPEALLDLRRYDGVTSFLLEATLGTKNAQPVAKMEAALAVLAPASTSFAVAA